MPSSPFIIRNYQPDDFNRYFKLRVESARAASSGVRPSSQAARTGLQRPGYSPRSDLFLAESKGHLAGYLDLTPEPEIDRILMDILIHPRFRGRGAAAELLRSARSRIRGAGLRYLMADVPADNHSARKWLTDQGFQENRHFLELVLDVDRCRLPKPILPSPGLRAFRPGEEKLLARIQNQAFAGSWGYRPNNADGIRYLYKLRKNEPRDILLLIRRDRTVAYCWTLVENRYAEGEDFDIGRIQMIGVLPDYRGQGLGRTMLMAGLNHLAAKGIRQVELTVDSRNPAACELYRSVGFFRSSKTLWFAKSLENTKDKGGR